MRIREAVHSTKWLPIIISTIGTGGSFILTDVPYQAILELMILGTASILAIVISVGLLSVQLAATQYTPLVVRASNSYSYILDYFWRFIFAITVTLVSYTIMLSSSPSFFPPVDQSLIRLGTSLLFGLAAGSVTFAIVSIQDMFNEAISTIDRNYILKSISSDIGLDDLREYKDERAAEGSTARHPTLVIYTMAKNAIVEGNTHASREAINHLNKATKNILECFKEQGRHSYTDEDLMKELFDFWESLGSLSIESDMRTVSWYWIGSFNSVIESCFSYGPSSVIKQSLHTYQIVAVKVISEMGLGDNHEQLLKFLRESIDKKRWDSYSTSLSTSNSIIQQAVKKHDQRFSNEIEPLLNEFFCSWHEVIESGLSESDIKRLSKQYDEILEEFIDLFSNPYELHSIELMDSHPYFVSKLETTGKTAAIMESEEAVKIITSILIDLFLSTRNPQRGGSIMNQVSRERYADTISVIADAGGRDAIKDVFQQFGELPRLELNEGDSRIEGYSELATELEGFNDWYFVRYNEFYLGRDIMQELIGELAEEVGIEFETNE